MYIKTALFAAKNWKELLLILMLLFVLIFMFFFNLQQPEDDLQFVGDGKGGKANVTALVRRYEPLIAKYAEKYAVADYVELLLAKMQQESGGRGGDPMQASESLGLPPNTIMDPEQSIDAGVKEFAEVLKAAGGDIKLTLQSYNFGPAFIDYAKEKGGYSKEVAAAFSNMMAHKLGWNRYGDINYVDNVLRYYTGAVFAGDMAINAYGFIKPVPTQTTSPFGFRYDPFTGAPSMHAGQDFSCNKEAIPVFAIKSGTVTRSGWENPSNPKQGFGQRVYIDHGDGLISVYAHLSQITVQPGQKIEQNQPVGRCGTTGSSTGMHLHLETHLNGSKVNPIQFIGG